MYLTRLYQIHASTCARTSGRTCKLYNKIIVCNEELWDVRLVLHITRKTPTKPDNKTKTLSHPTPTNLPPTNNALYPSGFGECVSVSWVYVLWRHIAHVVHAVCCLVAALLLLGALLLASVYSRCILHGFMVQQKRLECVVLSKIS